MVSNEIPKPFETDAAAEMDLDILPEAVESFVTNLGIALTPEQKQQLQGLLKRPNGDAAEAAKRRKTGGAPDQASHGHCG